MRHSANVKDDENNGCSCEACGRAYENPIRLTNLSAMPMQTYDACPFCFSKLKENQVSEEPDLKTSASNEASDDSGRSDERMERPEHIMCPQYFGYLKKRSKNVPIPDTCLTCQKMIQCLL